MKKQPKIIKNPEENKPPPELQTKSRQSDGVSSYLTTRDRWLRQITDDATIARLGMRICSLLSLHTNGKKFTETGELIAWPPQKYIADELDVTVPGIRKAIRALIARGHIAVNKQGKWRGDSTEYRLITQDAGAERVNSRVTPLQKERVNSRAQKGVTLEFTPTLELTTNLIKASPALKAGRDATPKRDSTHIDHHPELEEDDEDENEDELFAEFLEIWPKKDSQPELTEKTWARYVIKAGVDPEVVLAKAHLWNQAASRRKKMNIPYAGQWLKEQGWTKPNPHEEEQQLEEESPMCNEADQAPQYPLTAILKDKDALRIVSHAREFISSTTLQEIHNILADRLHENSADLFFALLFKNFTAFKAAMARVNEHANFDGSDWLPCLDAEIENEILYANDRRVNTRDPIEDVVKVLSTRLKHLKKSNHRASYDDDPLDED